jgi:hypothetical protein
MALLARIRRAFTISRPKHLISRLMTPLALPFERQSNVTCLADHHSSRPSKSSSAQNCQNYECESHDSRDRDEWPATTHQYVREGRNLACRSMAIY